MDLIKKVKGDRLIVAPDGLLDAVGGEEMLRAVSSAGEEIKGVIFDGMLMTGIESEGLEAIVRLRQALEDRGMDLLIRHPGEQLITALELTELVYFFNIEE